MPGIAETRISGTPIKKVSASIPELALSLQATSRISPMATTLKNHLPSHPSSA